MLPKNIFSVCTLTNKIKFFDVAKAGKFICFEMHIYCKIFFEIIKLI